MKPDNTTSKQIEQYKRYCNNLIEQHEAALKRAKEQQFSDTVIKAIERNISDCRENLKAVEVKTNAENQAVYRQRT